MVQRDLIFYNILGTEWNLLPEDESIVFIENHDTERGDSTNILNYKSHQQYKVPDGYSEYIASLLPIKIIFFCTTSKQRFMTNLFQDSFKSSSSDSEKNV